ncbi:MAG TPA: hypothetical protein VGL86_00450 [Polyangia bacterium]
MSMVLIDRPGEVESAAVARRGEIGRVVAAIEPGDGSAAAAGDRQSVGGAAGGEHRE